MAALLDVEALTVQFHGESGWVTAVEDVSFQVQPRKTESHQGDCNPLGGIDAVKSTVLCRILRNFWPFVCLPVSPKATQQEQQGSCDKQGDGGGAQKLPDIERKPQPDSSESSKKRCTDCSSAQVVRRSHGFSPIS